MFTGNRGCLVDQNGRMTRHHVGSLWITCTVDYRDENHPLDAPRTWTPLFFLDDAVALAAGHRPCGLCRRDDYVAYKGAVAAASSSGAPLGALDLNRLLHAERLRHGRGFQRSQDRITWIHELDSLPPGAVIIDAKSSTPLLITTDHQQPFGFDGWGPPASRRRGTSARVLTPPTSVAALKNGFAPRLHETAATL